MSRAARVRLTLGTAQRLLVDYVCNPLSLLGEAYSATKYLSNYVIAIADTLGIKCPEELREIAAMTLPEMVRSKAFGRACELLSRCMGVIMAKNLQELERLVREFELADVQL